MDAEVVFDPAPSPRASVVVLAWQDAPYLLDCLASIATSVRRVPFEVLLVLNEPSASLRTLVERFVRGAHILRTRVNVGFGGAVNLAASRARGEYLVLLNDDATVEQGWLEALVETADRRQAAAVGSSTLFVDGRLQEAGCVIWSDGSTIKVGRGDESGLQSRYAFERKVDFCSGTSLLVRRSIYDEVGGMDDAYFPAYYEDVDLCLRISRQGGEIWYAPRSSVRHQESASTNTSYRDYLFSRNRAVFLERWKDEIAKRDAPVPEDPNAIELAVWHAMGEPASILVIDDQVADPAIGSGYPRTAETLEDLVHLGYHLVMFTSLVDGALHNEMTARLGIEVLDGSFEDELRSYLEATEVRFVAALISRPHNYERFAPLLRQILPDLPIIYDAEALFHRRLARQAELATGSERDELLAVTQQMQTTEAAIAADADALVTISDEEAAFVRAHSSSLVYVHGPLLDGISPDKRGFDHRAGIGFVAGWAGGASSPNVDALLWFARDVLPLVLARIPSAKLRVTGLDPPEEVLRVAGEAIEFVGGVPDLSAFYAGIRVAIVPMRYGAGVKIKTIEALQHGVPTVATTVGAEGVPAEADVVLVSDDARGFARRVGGLLEDRDAWALQRRRILRQHRSWRTAGSVWADVVTGAIARRVRAPR